MAGAGWPMVESTAGADPPELLCGLPGVELLAAVKVFADLSVSEQLEATDELGSVEVDGPQKNRGMKTSFCFLITALLHNGHAARSRSQFSRHGL